MKLESKLKELRTSGEQSVAEQIESSHPADWDMESAFEKSYQAYLQKSGESVPIHRSRHKAVFRTVAAAACLLLTVGLSVGVWSKQQKIETKLPQETTVTTITQTETVTESETEMSTVSSTTVPTAETSVKAPETGTESETEMSTVSSTAVPAAETSVRNPETTGSTAIAAVHTVPANTSQITQSQSITTGIAKSTTMQQKITYTETSITAQHTEPADTFPCTSKEETTMNQTTKIQVQTTIATVMTTAALLTTQPIVTTAAETTTHAILPGFVTQYGDVNLDQEVSVMDVLMLQRYMLGLPAKIENWKNADLDKDGVIDIYDLAILKRGLTHNMEGIGGTMRVKLVDPATGEAPDTNAHVRLICRYQESDEVNDLFRVAEFDYTPGDIWEIRGLATGSAYLYELSIRDLEGGYGDQDGNWHRTLQATFDDETEMDLTLEVGEETPNVLFKEYDWALRSGFDDWEKQYYVMMYGTPVVTDQNGTKCEHSIYGSHWFRLPDGNYHAEWKLPQSNALVQLVDPESDFAKEIMAENPDVVFTDQSKGIDFTIKNGKPDKPLQFDFMPVEGINNQLTVNCIDSVTGEPVEGAKLSLILDPKGERETVESWTSDETGSRHFENLKISGYPSYMVQVDEMPQGYSGSFDTKTTTAYWTYFSEGSGDSQEITLKFVPDAAEKNVSIDLLNWEDKSLLNDLATYDILSGATNKTVMSGVKGGEKVPLPDGEYYAFLHGNELLNADYSVIFYDTVSGKRIFEENNLSFDEFVYNTALIHFTVKDGKPDRDLVFYVKPYESDDDIPVYPDIDYDPILKYFYGIE